VCFLFKNKATKDALYDMVSLMTGDIGLVHQLPFTSDKNGFSGQVEKIYFGISLARSYLIINLVGLNCVTGMSCLMLKSVLDECGGLGAFGSYIAEDFFMAQAFLDKY
jgi:ceramide glucosyltransferase